MGIHNNKLFIEPGSLLFADLLVQLLGLLLREEPILENVLLSYLAFWVLLIEGPVELRRTIFLRRVCILLSSLSDTYPGRKSSLPSVLALRFSGWSFLADFCYYGLLFLPEGLSSVFLAIFLVLFLGFSDSEEGSSA